MAADADKVPNGVVAMKVVFFTVAPIGSIAESGVYTDLVREFSARGWEVTVIAPAEARYGVSPGVSHEDGIRIIRVSTGGVTKVRSALRKGIATLLMEQRFITAIRRHLDGEAFDLVLYTAPPVNVDRVVRHFKARTPCHAYLMLKDIFPQNAVDLEMMPAGGITWRYFRHRERRLYAVSDTIGCMSDANVRYVRDHNPEVEPTKVQVCPNSIKPMPVPARRTGSMRAELGIPSNAFLLVYGGNLGVPQGLGFLLEVLDRCKERGDLYFVVAGSGTEFSRIDDHLTRGGHTNVQLIESLPRRDFTALLADADVGLVLLDQRFTIPNFPSRLTSYLEAGLPVITATDSNTDLPAVLAASGCGIGVEAGDLDGFMHAVDSMIADPEGLTKMGLRARRLLEDEYAVDRCYETIITRMGVAV